MKQKITFSVPFLLVLIVWISYPYVLSSLWAEQYFPLGDDWSHRGVIGDSFGALNTLFVGLALAGLAVNIYLQNAQLRKLEHKEQVNELQLAAQAEALRLTALLNYYNNEIDRLERLSERLSSFKDDETRSKFWTRFEEIKSKREEIVSSLTHPSSGTTNGAT